MPTIEIAPNDPLIAHLQPAAGAVDVDDLDLDSPALRAMKAAGVELVVPLVSQGELIGLLNLGRRRSGQAYSGDDRALLNSLVAQAAPAVRVAQMVREQHAEAQAREGIEQELRVARLIQQTLLPRAVPELPGWRLAAYYRPARAVGGDYYDFLDLPHGRLGLIIADVTDKGVPAALVMATTRSVLRAAAQRLNSPAQVLERANELLCPDMPPNMFVTCLYAILDPASGRLSYANAGHLLPYRRHEGVVTELRATGVPLGLMPEMHYEERDLVLAPGESVLFYSDGLVEAHNPRREMLGFPRLRRLVTDDPDGGTPLIDYLMDEFERFTGADCELEDDITLVTLQRSPSPVSAARVKESIHSGEGQAGDVVGDGEWRTLAEWTVPSEPGNERLAVDQVAAAVRVLDVPARRLERLKTAVAEATMNAMEHGNKYHPGAPVGIRVRASEAAVSVRITDQGDGPPIAEPEPPDLEAKVSRSQPPRGWGLFLIKHMVDEMLVTGDETGHTVELVVRLKGDGDAGQAP
ncbi:MAG: SpoIIE family protein phosphatase [Chloroflexota bacterium]|nr:SpoIIE family protein phosphatase [Chloroflexota bacterium]